MKSHFRLNLKEGNHNLPICRSRELQIHSTGAFPSRISSEHCHTAKFISTISHRSSRHQNIISKKGQIRGPKITTRGPCQKFHNNLKIYTQNSSPSSPNQIFVIMQLNSVGKITCKPNLNFSPNLTYMQQQKYQIFSRKKGSSARNNTTMKFLTKFHLKTHQKSQTTEQKRRSYSSPKFHPIPIRISQMQQLNIQFHQQRGNFRWK